GVQQRQLVVAGRQRRQCHLAAEPVPASSLAGLLLRTVARPELLGLRPALLEIDAPSQRRLLAVPRTAQPEPADLLLNGEYHRLQPVLQAPEFLALQEAVQRGFVGYLHPEGMQNAQATGQGDARYIA